MTKFYHSDVAFVAKLSENWSIYFNKGVRDQARGTYIVHNTCNRAKYYYVQKGGTVSGLTDKFSKIPKCTCHTIPVPDHILVLFKMYNVKDKLKL